MFLNFLLKTVYSNSDYYNYFRRNAALEIFFQINATFDKHFYKNGLRVTKGCRPLGSNILIKN